MYNTNVYFQKTRLKCEYGIWTQSAIEKVSLLPDQPSFTDQIFQLLNIILFLFFPNSFPQSIEKSSLGTIIAMSINVLFGNSQTKRTIYVQNYSNDAILLSQTKQAQTSNSRALISNRANIKYLSTLRLRTNNPI